MPGIPYGYLLFSLRCLLYEHVVTMPSSSIFWNTAAKSQEWTWMGQGWIVTGPWAPTDAAKKISKRPLWPFSSCSPLCSECGFYGWAWRPQWASSQPASWACTTHSPATPSALAFCSSTFLSGNLQIASLPSRSQINSILVMLSRQCLKFPS